MRISLLRISLLRFFKKFHEFALCVVLMQILFHYCDFWAIFGLFLANVNLANVNFFQNQKSY